MGQPDFATAEACALRCRMEPTCNAFTWLAQPNPSNNCWWAKGRLCWPDLAAALTPGSLRPTCRNRRHPNPYLCLCLCRLKNTAGAIDTLRSDPSWMQYPDMSRIYGFPTTRMPALPAFTLSSSFDAAGKSRVPARLGRPWPPCPFPVPMPMPCRHYLQDRAYYGVGSSLRRAMLALRPDLHPVFLGQLGSGNR